MTNPETAGQARFREDVAYALRLLNRGYTPEEVEEMLERYHQLTERRPTALSDPTNVLMVEVPDGAAD
jgi:hypothetical protein